MQPIIDIHHLSASYQHHLVLDNVSAAIAPGSFLGIIGPNGAGKSTLLKTMVGLMPPTSGSVTFFGGTFARYAKHIAYVPQRFAVDWDFPITVIEVVLMGRYCHVGWFRRPQKKDYDLAYHALETIGMLAYAQTPITDLSGGQQQRVFLARALAQEATIYLLDEPLSGIDAITEQQIISILTSERDKGKTICMVHHDLQTITAYFDTLLILNKKRIAFGPTAQVYQQPILQQAYNRQVCMPHV